VHHYTIVKSLVVVTQNDLSPFVQILPEAFFWVVGSLRKRKRKNRMDFFSIPQLKIVYLWVKNTHEDSMSIFRSIVSSPVHGIAFA